MWQCTKCHERLEEAFAVCWKCGTSKDGIEDPAFRHEVDVGGTSEGSARDDKEATKAVHDASAGSLVCVCGGTCEAGFVLDVMYGGYMPATWVEGQPERSFWRGTKIGDRPQYRIEAFRCRKCGRIELFAREPRTRPW